MARSYDLKLVVCTVGGVPISGYGEDDALEFEWASDLVEKTKSADGKVTYSRLNDRECVCTITLMATSKAIPLLQALLETQHGDNLGIAPPIIVPMPFLMTDPSTGDNVVGECVFENRPAPSKSRTVGEVEFRVSLPSPKWTLGVANLI